MTADNQFFLKPSCFVIFQPGYSLGGFFFVDERQKIRKMGSMSYEHPLLQELEIKSLLCRERYYRDTAQWQKLRDCYHPDAGKTRVEISWYDYCRCTLQATFSL